MKIEQRSRREHRQKSGNNDCINLSCSYGRTYGIENILHNTLMVKLWKKIGNYP
jgi:hypothetical protein